jgi:hypothetical protein
MKTKHLWVFRSRFRRGCFGWRGSSKAIERIDQALSEILLVTRTDPALGAEGAVILLTKVSPALQDVDSSSGSLGNAAYRMVETLVPIIAQAPVTQQVRSKWLEQLFEAYQDDDPPYIESLADHWGALCATKDLASRWADELLPLVRSVMRDRRNGVYAYSKSCSVCWSALFTANRHDELLEALALDPKPYWGDQQWVARVRSASGDMDGAIASLERLRSSGAPESVIWEECERMLIDAGRVEQAYERYGVLATRANTHLATFRAIARKYPGIAAERILADLIAASPGEEGKWFAAARSLKKFDQALALARRSRVDPRTLITAAKGQIKTQPAFALEVALIALRSIADGWGYEITGVEVHAAMTYAKAAAASLGREDLLAGLIAEATSGATPSARWVRQCVGLAAD